jgi:3-deoxy-D-arabino-heptulosonate 7-phosphate (DAHP) synthase class II
VQSILTHPTFSFTYSTQTSAGTGLKTRHFNNIISELTASLRIHAECGSRLGGVSLEFTGELNEEGYSVTECLGGSMELSEEELGLRYQVRSFFLDRIQRDVELKFICFFARALFFSGWMQSFCDPRLNFEQSLGE